jgi:hypothetical protein
MWDPFARHIHPPDVKKKWLPYSLRSKKISHANVQAPSPLIFCPHRMLQKLLWSTAAWLVPLVDALCVDLRGILVIFLAALVCMPNPTIIYIFWDGRSISNRRKGRPDPPSNNARDVLVTANKFVYVHISYAWRRTWKKMLRTRKSGFSSCINW